MVARKLPIEQAVSAGGVVWRRDGRGRLQVVVCGRRSERIWCLPKGTPDGNELIEETAIREVEEETGLTVRMGAPLGSIEYWFTALGVRYHKLVHHWLMEPTGGDVSHHDHEFDEVRWLPAEEALTLLTYDGERELVVRAVQELGEKV